MLIKPLPSELIGKLEVAIFHRNREWAIAVLDEALEREENSPPINDETPLNELFSVRDTGLLESSGFMFLGQLKRVDLNELKTCRGIVPFLFERVKIVLAQHANSKT